MFRENSDSLVARRSFLTRVAAGFGLAGAGTAIGGTSLLAQSAGRPARHAQDDWMDKLPSKHRLVIDTTSPAGFGVALAYANNFLEADKDGYGLTDQDHGIIIVARHFATPFAYDDTFWAKYGKGLPPFVALDDPKTKQRPAFNIFKVGGYGLDLPNLGTTIDDVTKKGVHFAVCQLATRFFAGQLAQGTGGNADAIFKELVASIVPNSHMAAAGIVAVNRAQEHGYTLATAT
jgi:hypothetical protein